MRHWILRRAPSPRRSMRSTKPSSSTIPVNISLHREFVPGDVVKRQTVNADRVHPPPPARAARHRQGLNSAQNLRAVIEEYLVGYPRFERRPVHPATSFDHQRKALL